MYKEKLNRVISLRIKQLREGKGYSQTDLADLLNKDRQSIQRIESSKITPTIFTLFNIARALDVTLSELFNVEDLNERE